jgi:hypothetical protein
MGTRVEKFVEFVKAVHDAGLETRGFSAITFSFSQDFGFISALLDRLSNDEHPARLLQELSFVFGALRSSNPQEYRRRAREARRNGPAYLTVAASSALRVFSESATQDDALLISEFAGSEIPVVKRYVLHAIAYMGRDEAVLPMLLDAALSVDIGKDSGIADDLAEAFGPYGVPLRLLTEEKAKLLLAKFLPLEDFDDHQGTVPRFLCQMLGYFPEEVLDLLIERIKVEEQRRSAHDWAFRALGVQHHAVLFGSTPAEKIPELLRKCLEFYLRSLHSADTAAELFWSIDPTWKHSFAVLTEKLESACEAQILKVDELLHRCPRGSVLAYEALAKTAQDLPLNDRKRIVVEEMVARAEATRSQIAGGE